MTLALLRSHWAKLLALLLIAAAFIAGRASAPTGPAFMDDSTTTKTAEVQKIVVKIVEHKTEKKIVYRDKTTKPDGTVIEHEEERTDTKTDTNTDATGTKEVIKEVVREVKVEAHRPDWRVSLMAGVQPTLDPLGIKPAFGVMVERRVLGPFSVNVWGLHTGVIGIGISGEF